MPSISTSSAKLSRIPDDDDHAQYDDAFVGRVDDDRPHDVGHDQHFQAKQNRATEVAAQLLVGAGPTLGLGHAHEEDQKRPESADEHISAPA